MFLKAIFFFLEKQIQCVCIQVVHVRLFSDIGHFMTKIDWEGIYMHIKLTQIKFCACTLLGLKNMPMSERVKSATAGPVANTH